MRCSLTLQSGGYVIEILTQLQQGNTGREYDAMATRIR